MEIERPLALYPPQSDEKARETIEESIQRSFEDYLERLNLTVEDLKDKKILDIGAGGGKFAQGAQEQGIDVVSLDSVYSFPVGRELIQENLGEKASKVVAGESERLPFKDGSFDILINMGSAFKFCPRPELLKSMLEEQLRVLRENGNIYIYPMEEIENEDYYDDIVISSGKGKFFLGIDESNSDIKLDLVGEFSKLIKEGLENGSFEIDVVSSQAEGEKGFWTLVIKKIKKE